MSAWVHVPVGYAEAALVEGLGVGVGTGATVGAGAGTSVPDAVGVVGAEGPQAVRSSTAPIAATRGSRLNMQKGYRRYTDL
jgi:hypothetical protein